MFVFSFFLFSISFTLIQSQQLSPIDQLSKGQNGICTRDAKGRTVGKPMIVQCKENEEQRGALCYPKCKEGFERIGCCTCRKKTCANKTYRHSVGRASCIKPSHYNRGMGYPIRIGEGSTNKGMFKRCEKEHGCGNCEQVASVVYPKCKPGFRNVGCCLCTPICGENEVDMGPLCMKEKYFSSKGVERWTCPKGLEKDGLLCYPKCKNSYKGIGPVCWQKCPSSLPYNCGVFCTANQQKCIETIEKLSRVGGEFVGAALSGVIGIGMGIASGIGVGSGIAGVVNLLQAGTSAGKKLSNSISFQPNCS